MIEISHRHAQHLIREGIDRQLPDEQWAMLQAHLEGCPSCREYSSRLTRAERRMNHSLKLRWGAARGPEANIASYLLQRRARRVKLFALLKKAAWVALGVLVLLGFNTYRRITNPPPATLPPSFNMATLEGLRGTPTPETVISFHGLVAYEGTLEGSADIFLLNASGGKVDVTNLTQHPAADTSPVWSPDGEWIAFLSDRSGKNEIYAVTVAGTRLTQLTGGAGLEWQGPLSWSNDGRTIAALGRRSDGNTFLYLVGIDGSAPRSVAGTRGALPWARFSPSLSILAYSPAGQPGGLALLNVENGWTAWLTEEDNAAFQFAAVAGAFDWSLGGRSLVYAVDGPRVSGAPAAQSGSLLRLSPEVTARGDADFRGAGADTVDRLPTAGAFQAVSWVPSSLQIAALYDDGKGCRTLRINHAYNRQVQPRDLRDLCVLGGLERSSWTSDGNWLVLLAEEAEAQGSAPGLYAVQPGAGEIAPIVERLQGGEELSRAALVRVRPTARSLRLNPRRSLALESPAVVTPTRVPGAANEGLPAWVAYTVRRDGGAGEILVRARPDGSQAQDLTPAGSRSSCPSIGPGGQVAFLSDMPAGEAGSPSLRQEVFVTGAGGEARRLTGDALPEELGGTDPASIAYGYAYGCPVWSADGARLAAVMKAGERAYLAVLDANGASAPVYIPIAGAGSAEPVWLPQDESGRSSILMVTPARSQPAQLVEIDVDSALADEDRVVWSSPLLGWDDAWGLALSPDGAQIAVWMVYFPEGARQDEPSAAQLRILDTATREVLSAVTPANLDAGPALRGALGWAADGSVRLARAVSNIGSRKSIFERYHPQEDRLENRLVETAVFEDVIYDAVWGPGDWVLFTAESGLWAMNCPPEGAGACAPGQISGEVVLEVDWK